MATTFRFNSLTTRIAGAIAVTLLCFGAVIGIILYRNIKHSVMEELRGHLHQRIAWLANSVDMDEGKLEFDPKLPESAALQNWRIVTTDGRVLWSSSKDVTWPDSDPAFAYQTKLVEIGDPNANALPDSEIHPVAPAAASSFQSYALNTQRGKIALRLTVREPLAHTENELRRVALALLTIGPAAIFILIVILTLFIRWQLKSLTGMSIQAAAIGPENTKSRIGLVGSSIELVRLRESINQMVNRLAEGMQRERQFSSMAAHELRTPLTQMRMNVEIALNKERDASEYKDALRSSLEDIERLQQLVANLLFLTRDYRGPEMEREVELPKVVQRAAKSCGSNALIQAEGHNIVVRGNEELIQCAVRNVLENALRYAPGRPAQIEYQQSEGRVELHISDCGPGILAEDQERIFEPLTRLDAARTIGSESGGFGLGLTVARSAARACGGELVCKVRGDGNSGAEFVFTFICKIA